MAKPAGKAFPATPTDLGQSCCVTEICVVSPSPRKYSSGNLSGVHPQGGSTRGDKLWHAIRCVKHCQPDVQARVSHVPPFAVSVVQRQQSLEFSRISLASTADHSLLIEAQQACCGVLSCSTWYSSITICAHASTARCSYRWLRSLWKKRRDRLVAPSQAPLAAPHGVRPARIQRYILPFSQLHICPSASGINCAGYLRSRKKSLHLAVLYSPARSRSSASALSHTCVCVP